MEYNYRLNHRQSIKHGLVSSDLSDFYDLFVIENINSMRFALNKSALYPGLCSVFDYADTGERFGFQSNMLGSPADETIELVDTLTSSKLSLPIRTSDEIRKFKKELSGYLPNPNFDNWAIKWNIAVDRMCSFDTEFIDIAPKSATHLKKYFDFFAAKGNQYNSIANNREEIWNLAGELRKPDVSKHPSTYSSKKLVRDIKEGGMVLSVNNFIESSISTNITSCSLDQQGKECNAARTGMLCLFDIILETEFKPSQPTIKKKRRMSCSACGHFKSYGLYRAMHDGKGQQCRVASVNRRIPFGKSRKCGENGCRRTENHYHDCKLPCCVDDQ
jgi:hypothetical protein